MYCIGWKPLCILFLESRMRWKSHVRFGGSVINNPEIYTWGLIMRPNLLTTIIMPIALVSNWNSIVNNIKSYLIIILLLETLLLAVFLVLDVLLFYIFFESILPPALWFRKSLIQGPNSLYSSPISTKWNRSRGQGSGIKLINIFRSYSTVHQKPEL